MSYEHHRYLDGSEEIVWGWAEWRDDPALVMGAIVTSAAGTARLGALGGRGDRSSWTWRTGTPRSGIWARCCASTAWSRGSWRRGGRGRWTRPGAVGGGNGLTTQKALGPEEGGGGPSVPGP